MNVVSNCCAVIYVVCLLPFIMAVLSEFPLNHPRTCCVDAMSMFSPYSIAPSFAVPTLYAFVPSAVTIPVFVNQIVLFIRSLHYYLNFQALHSLFFQKLRIPNTYVVY